MNGPRSDAAAAAIRRVLAGLFATTWLVLPGFGLIDLTVTWNAEWPQVLEAGWGMYMTALVAVPFVVLAVRSPTHLPAEVQLYVVGGALVVSAVVAAEWWLTVWGAAVVVETAIVAGLPRRHRRPRAFRLRGHPLMLVAAFGVVPWSIYAITMWSLACQQRTDSDVTMGIDHFAVQGAFGLAVLALVAVAACWPVGRRLLGTCAGLSAVYLGIVSLFWHPTPGSLGPIWSALCVLWGLAATLLAFYAPRSAADPIVPRLGVR
jgi:hypothetical protein